MTAPITTALILTYVRGRDLPPWTPRWAPQADPTRYQPYGSHM